MLVLLLFLVISPFVLLLFLVITASLFKVLFGRRINKNWIDLHKYIPSVQFKPAGEVWIKNIVKAQYNPQNEFDYKFETIHKKYNLHDLRNVWFIENNYAPLQSHVFLTFQFSYDKFLCVSPEVRKTSLLDFEVWHVLTKRFSIFYRFSTEQDILFLRTNIRNSPTIMYRLNLTQEQMEKLFVSICNTANLIHKKDLIYTLFISDCVNVLLKNFKEANIPIKKHFYIWSPTKVLWRSGLVKGEYKDLKDLYQKSYLNKKTMNLEPDENFSFEIRK